MSLFDRFRRKRSSGASNQHASGRTLSELGEFMASRHGVEAYAEPPTSVYAMSLCLVAADGEYLRRPVKDEKQAKQVCADHGVPLYDARLVGYPRRMREYQRGTPQHGISLDDLPPLETTREHEHNPDRDE